MVLEKRFSDVWRGPWRKQLLAPAVEDFTAAFFGHVARVSGGDSALPFVHLFYGRPSTHLWEDDQGVQGEQGDPLMHFLFAVGQHAGLVATYQEDDICTLSTPS